MSRLLVVAGADGPVCRWEGLMGRLYGLGLDDQQRAFLGLVMGMVGIGLHICPRWRSWTSVGSSS
ncbi:hypothetical protein KJK32_05070 [Streptomyces sp. JCM17656]|nr:hypothetical protein KJK32_05070 [Streptomyces sp. JCM17656]